MSSTKCIYYDSKPSECTKATCEVRSTLSANTKYCPIYFCKLSGKASGASTNYSNNTLKQTPQEDIPRSSSTESISETQIETYKPSTHSSSSTRTAINSSTRLLYEKKRKAALIGVLTLGLAGLSVIGVGETWRMNIFSGTSFDKGGVGFIMKIVSFCLISLLVAVPCFIISIIQLIYYSIKLSH